MHTVQSLSLQTIRRIRQLQLVAESHDQGFADVPSAGNWTWLDIAILDSADSLQPKNVDGVQMLWTSHYNNFVTDDYEWVRNVSFARHQKKATGILTELSHN